MNDDRKLIFVIVVSITVLLLWMKSDPTVDDEDDPDVVTVDYRCSMLDQYKFVPDEVITECASRMNELESKKHTTKQNTSTTT